MKTKIIHHLDNNGCLVATELQIIIFGWVAFRFWSNLEK